MVTKLATGLSKGKNGTVAAKEAVQQAKEQLGADRVDLSIPMLGWETYGEIRLEPGQFSGFHNTTSVVLLLPKGDK